MREWSRPAIGSASGWNATCTMARSNRLIALSLELGVLGEGLHSDPGTQEQLARARGQIPASLEELRAVARGIHPAVVSGHGLEVALEQLAARATVPVRLRVTIGSRLPERLEVAAFYLVPRLSRTSPNTRTRSTATVDVERDRRQCRDRGPRRRGWRRGQRAWLRSAWAGRPRRGPRSDGFGSRRRAVAARE